MRPLAFTPKQFPSALIDNVYQLAKVPQTPFSLRQLAEFSKYFLIYFFYLLYITVFYVIYKQHYQTNITIITNTV